METVNKLKFGFLLSCVAILLTGCFGKKKNSKKVDYVTSSSKKKRGVKKWDPTLEAYVFEGEDSEDMLALNNEKHGEFQKIYYGFDKTETEDKAGVDYNAKLAKAKVEEGHNVILVGKSDTHCISEVYNTVVSQKRADELAKEFKIAGVSTDRINAIGVGDTQLEVPVKGKEALNRCVVVQVS